MIKSYFFTFSNSAPFVKHSSLSLSFSLGVTVSRCVYDVITASPKNLQCVTLVIICIHLTTLIAEFASSKLNIPSLSLSLSLSFSLSLSLSFFLASTIALLHQVFFMSK